eukprot:403334879
MGNQYPGGQIQQIVDPIGLYSPGQQRHFFQVWWTLGRLRSNQCQNYIQSQDRTNPRQEIYQIR